MAIWHLTWSADGRRTFFSEEAACRRAVRALLRVAGRRAVLFNLVDDHVHLVADVDAAELGHLTRTVLLALRACTEVPFSPVFVKEVAERAHLETLVRYVLDQGPHHGLSAHPALATGSCFSDMVGARVLPGFELRLPSLLPRFRMRAAYAVVGLGTDRPLAPADDAALAAAGPARLLAACSSATAAPPDLAGRESCALDARTAFVQLSRVAGFSSAVVAKVGGIPLRSAQFLAHREPSPAVLGAVRLRIALEDAVRALPPVVREPDGPVYDPAPDLPALPPAGAPGRLR